MFRRAVRPLLALAVALAPALADGALYRWVDELGVTHYATDLEAIPSSARENALEIVASPAPAGATRALPVPPVPAEPAPAPLAPVDAAPAAPAPEVAPVGSESRAATEGASIASEPTTATEPPTAAETSPTVFPGPPATPEIPASDPRAAEVAELEARISADREQLRQMISTKRWDSAELASDPSIREIAERLPRLQAELAALRGETAP